MANPHWRIWVDWDQDGIWGESGPGGYEEDVAGDVMALNWRWGRTAGPGGSSDRAAPAALELVLRNHHGKYPPGSPRSPLAGLARPGRRVWAAFAYPYDGFAGAGDLAGRAPAVGAGLVWVQELSGGGGVAVSGGQARPVAGKGPAVYTLDWGEADAHLGFTYRRESDGGSGVALRCVNQWDYLRVRFGSRGTVLEDVSFGYATGLRRGPALSAGVNYYIEIELHGGSVRLFATDLDGGSMDRRQILDGAGSAGNLTAARHGLWHDGGAAAAWDHWGAFGGWRSFFCGAVESFAPAVNPEQGPACRLRAADDLQGLGQARLHNLLRGRNLTAAAIANRLLTWAGFNVNRRRLDAGQTLVAAEPRALWDLPARSALYALQDEEDGFLYLDGRGYVRLEASGHRQSGAHTTARATLGATLEATLGAMTKAGPYCSRQEAAGGDGRLESSVTFRYRRLADQGRQEVWRLRDVPAIPAGESRELVAESGSYDVVDRFQVPVAGSDYAANSRFDGSGADLTGSLAVSLPDYSSNTAAYAGKGTVVRLRNNHAVETAYVTRLRLRAARAYQALEATRYQAEPSKTPDAPGGQSVVVECRYIDNYTAARQSAESRLARKGTDKVLLWLTLPNGNGKNIIQMVHRVLSDRVKLGVGAGQLAGDCYIEGMELKAEARTGEVTARWLVREA